MYSTQRVFVAITEQSAIPGTYSRVSLVFVIHMYFKRRYVLFQRVVCQIL